MNMNPRVQNQGAVCAFTERRGPKQNKTKQTKQNKTKQNKQNKAKQSKAKQNKTKQNKQTNKQTSKQASKQTNKKTEKLHDLSPVQLRMSNSSQSSVDSVGLFLSDLSQAVRVLDSVMERAVVWVECVYLSTSP